MLNDRFDLGPEWSNSASYSELTKAFTTETVDVVLAAVVAGMMPDAIPSGAMDFKTAKDGIIELIKFGYIEIKAMASPPGMRVAVAMCIPGKDLKLWTEIVIADPANGNITVSA